ncbi:MAG: hypothetical protein IPK07_05270 [Deltaproteobacteria bacterium]|nr:hypothetical protein [Deltaproteobacteria bacterium]
MRRASSPTRPARQRITPASKRASPASSSRHWSAETRTNATSLRHSTEYGLGKQWWTELKQKHWPVPSIHSVCSRPSSESR